MNYLHIVPVPVCTLFLFLISILPYSLFTLPLANKIYMAIPEINTYTLEHTQDWSSNVAS